MVLDLSFQGHQRNILVDASTWMLIELIQILDYSPPCFTFFCKQPFGKLIVREGKFGTIEADLCTESCSTRLETSNQNLISHLW